MGEWSKSIGEKGEKITKFVFEEILGINSLVENESISCNHETKHKRPTAKKGRTTHGLDGLYYLESPLEDELLDIVIISSKYTTAYPKNPKSLFKEHLTDLAHTLECFNLSKENSEINQKFSTVTKTSLTGILVWLSNSDELNFDIKPTVSNSILNNSLEFEKIVLLDNNRIWFLYEAIYKSKMKYHNLQYVYHNSSLNQVNINLSSYGDKFPVNYLYSDIITLRVVQDGKILFLIYINDDFDKTNLSQVLSLAKTYDHLNSTAHTYINYLNYDHLIHSNPVKSVLADYKNFKLDKNLTVSKFPSDFRL
jgi:hypothetical protein